MKRFTHEKNHIWRKQIFSAALFLLIFLAFLWGISGVSGKAAKQRTQSLEQAISRSIAHCYATEGYYPESLSYIQEHYGISYDPDEFFVDYQVLGENIFPDVTIIEKQEKYK